MTQKLLLCLIDDKHKGNIIQSLKENVNNNPFSGHIKFMIWNIKQHISNYLLS